MSQHFVTQDDVEISEALLDFIRKSPTPFHAVREIVRRLDRAGCLGLHEADDWHIERGKTYYTTRNGSSLVAFHVGADVSDPCFHIAASHGDSPTYKLKTHAELTGPGPYLRLNTEGYGGVIDRTWLDRPLTVAGRVMVEEDGIVDCRLLHVDRDILLIPSLAVHLNRDVNEKGSLNRQIDLLPLVSSGLSESTSFDEFIAQQVGVMRGQILAHDLFLVNRQTPLVWGIESEFVSAPRLDDLQCAFSALIAFLGECSESTVSVYVCFDNEEVGSGTMQGALSSFLSDVLERICLCLNPADPACFRRAIARSFMVSCDNAHAVHPNHPELHDEGNRAWLNGGVVIKEAASQRYATDAVGRALFERICRDVGVPTQAFANRSDMVGGATLGNLSTRQVSVHTVDIGLAQLAMHSAYETAGVKDSGYLIEALRSFFSSDFVLEPGGTIVF